MKQVCFQLTIAYWRAGIPMSRAITGESDDVDRSETTVTCVDGMAVIEGRGVHPRAVIRDGWVATV